MDQSKDYKIHNTFKVEVPKQQHLLGGLDRDEDKEEEGQEETWTREAKEEDNERYRNFLKYMEEKREEARQHLLEEKDRKRGARKKEESWALMRESVAFLRTNADKWRKRKIEECDRIREEEKKERLGVVKEKKRKYGIKRLSKEENMRMTKRTEERLEIARAKENLWRQHREQGEMKTG
jgi:hypothetical protein